MCMKSWMEKGVAHLDSDLFERTVSLLEPQDATTQLEDLSDESDGSCVGV